jgi:hypothetical protein
VALQKEEEFRGVHGNTEAIEGTSRCHIACLRYSESMERERQARILNSDGTGQGRCSWRTQTVIYFSHGLVVPRAAPRPVVSGPAAPPVSFR